MEKDLKPSEFKDLKKKNRRLNEKWGFFFEDLTWRNKMAIHF